VGRDGIDIPDVGGTEPQRLAELAMSNEKLWDAIERLQEFVWSMHQDRV
jgi:hypothetical protein